MYKWQCLGISDLPAQPTEALADIQIISVLFPRMKEARSDFMHFFSARAFVLQFQSEPLGRKLGRFNHVALIQPDLSAPSYPCLLIIAN